MEESAATTLEEPLLPSSNGENGEATSNDVESPPSDNNKANAAANGTVTVVAENETDDNNDENGDADNNNNNDDYLYTISGELLEMVNLGLPLAISFFCRMGMASTDSAFVGHITSGSHTAMTYLAAATLSDMVVNVLLIPPLAFNQVLNALVGQAVGSGNPKMAGIWLQQSMFWLSLTMLPCLVGCFYVEPILRMLDFPADVSHVAGLYSKFNVVWPIPNGLVRRHGHFCCSVLLLVESHNDF